jgi:hypothetical protein
LNFALTHVERIGTVSGQKEQPERRRTMATLVVGTFSTLDGVM